MDDHERWRGGVDAKLDALHENVENIAENQGRIRDDLGDIKGSLGELRGISAVTGGLAGFLATAGALWAQFKAQG